MKTIIRMVIMVCLMAVAVTMVTFTAAGFRKASDGNVPDSGSYVLADYGGSVAIFDGGNMETPMQVTDIDLGTLRATDRKMIETGVPVSTREELMALLEDLGS